MGKNTMMKRSIRIFCETSGTDKWACLLEQLVGNVGIVFTVGRLHACTMHACVPAHQRSSISNFHQDHTKTCKISVTWGLVFPPLGCACAAEVLIQ